MAITVEQANAVSAEGFDETLINTIYEDSPFFVKLKADNKITRAGGRDIRFPLRYIKLSKANAMNPRDQWVYEQKDTRTAGVLDWKYYGTDTMISWDERVKNAGGKFQIVSLVKDKTKELREDMFDRMATDLYTQNANLLGFSALPTIVDGTTSYAGISPADATAWKAGNDSAETTLTLYSGTNSLARAVSAATFGKKSPTIHITTYDLQNKFEALMAANIRYEDKQMANAGFANVTFRRAPVVADEYCPASQWYGLDTSVIEFVVSSDDDFAVSPWIKADQAGFPKAMIKYMSFAGNLKSEMRRTHLKFTALAYTN